jgi:hypothetical protein
MRWALGGEGSIFLFLFVEREEDRRGKKRGKTKKQEKKEI